MPSVSRRSGRLSERIVSHSTARLTASASPTSAQESRLAWPLARAAAATLRATASWVALITPADWARSSANDATSASASSRSASPPRSSRIASSVIPASGSRCQVSASRSISVASSADRGRKRSSPSPSSKARASSVSRSP